MSTRLLPLHPLFGLIAGQVFLHAAMSGMRMALPLSLLENAGAGHGGEALVGPVVALFAVAPMLLALPAGRLADRRGYHLPVRIAVLLSCAGGVCALAASLWPELRYLAYCGAATLSGAGCNIGLTTIQRSAGRSARDVTELKRTFSWLGMAPSVSNFLGPAIAGPLLDHSGTGATFAVLAALPLLSLVVARWVPSEAPPPPRAAGPQPAWDLLSTPILRRLLAVSQCMSASWDAHSFLVPVLGHQRGLSASAIAAVLGTFALAVTGVRLLIPMLAHRLGEAQTLRFAMLQVSLALAVYPFAQSVFAMSACAVGLGFALGASQPMVMTMLHQITPSARHGEAIALRAMASSASSAVAPLAFGAVSQLLGAGGLFWFMSLLVSTGAVAARGLDPSHIAAHAPHD